MKLKIIPICLALALSINLTACTSGKSTGKSTEISCDDFYKSQHISKQLEVTAGESFTVILCSNASTGFRWSDSAQIGSPNVMEQTKHEYIMKEYKTPPPPGTPGQEIWTFKALRPGTSTTSMEYSRPWEGGEKREWTFKLTVVVKSGGKYE